MKEDFCAAVPSEGCLSVYPIFLFFAGGGGVATHTCTVTSFYSRHLWNGNLVSIVARVPNSDVFGFKHS